MALENVERHQERTFHIPWVSSLNHNGVQQLQVPSISPGKGPRPCFILPHPVSGFCVLMSPRSRGGRGAGWQLKPHLPGEADPAFCPSLSRVPLSPISVRSPSSKICKSYTDRKGGKEKDINCPLLPPYTFSISSSYKYLINIHTCSATKSYSTLCNPMD